MPNTASQEILAIQQSRGNLQDPVHVDESLRDLLDEARDLVESPSTATVIDAVVERLAGLFMQRITEVTALAPEAEMIFAKYLPVLNSGTMFLSDSTTRNETIKVNLFINGAIIDVVVVVVERCCGVRKLSIVLPWLYFHRLITIKNSKCKHQFNHWYPLIGVILGYK